MSRKRSVRSGPARTSGPEALYKVDEKHLDTEKKCSLLTQYATAMSKTEAEASKLRSTWVDDVIGDEWLKELPLVAEVAYRKARKAFVKWFKAQKKTGEKKVNKKRGGKKK